MSAKIRTLPNRMAEGEITFDTSNPAPIIAPGTYEAVYVHHETKYIFQSPKVFVWFRIVSPGPAFDVLVYRAYRARALTTKAGRYGGFKVARGSDIYHDLGRILNTRVRPDRVSAIVLRGAVYRIKVRTVTKDHKQRPIPEWGQYSVVDQLLHSETVTKPSAVSI